MDFTGRERGFKAVLWISLYFMRLTHNFDNIVAAWDELTIDARRRAALPFGQADTMQTYPLEASVLDTLPVEELDIVLELLGQFPVEYEKVTNQFAFKLTRTGWDERIGEIKLYFNKQ